MGRLSTSVGAEFRAYNDPMTRLASIAVVLVAAILTTSQEPGPPPRVIPSPATQRVYAVQVFRDGVYQTQRGVDNLWELDDALYDLALRFCTSPRQFERTDGMLDPSKPIPRPRIEVAIWDSQRERWSSPDGLRGRDEPWLWALTVRVNVGSMGID